MIQINLVPDIKQDMLRAQRMRNFTISISILVGFIAVGAVGALALIMGAQVVAEGVTAKQIDQEYKKLASTKDIDSTLTIQNQLDKISGINDKRTVNSRLLDILLAINPAAPNDVKLSKVTLDPVERTLSVEGSAAGGYPATDTFRKTILNASVTAKQNNQDINVPLTSDVVLQNTSYGQDSSGAKVVRFTVVFAYPDGLFDNTMSNVKINTPSAKIDVTDSKTRVPDSMFSQAATDVEGGQ